MIKIDKHIIWAWAFKNTMCVALWIGLAISFNHWWIALFSILFLSEISSVYKDDSVEAEPAEFRDIVPYKEDRKNE